MVSILVIDDDEGMCETLSDILEVTGYEVTIANDGYQALEVAKEKKIDISLIDIKMPGINGVETFKEMKKFSPDTYVIMMTAYAVEDLIEEAIQEGVNTILYKPLNIEEILDSIETQIITGCCTYKMQNRYLIRSNVSYILA